MKKEKNMVYKFLVVLLYINSALAYDTLENILKKNKELRAKNSITKINFKITKTSSTSEVKYGFMILEKGTDRRLTLFLSDTNEIKVDNLFARNEIELGKGKSESEFVIESIFKAYRNDENDYMNFLVKSFGGKNNNSLESKDKKEIFKNYKDFSEKSKTASDPTSANEIRSFEVSLGKTSYYKESGLGKNITEGGKKIILFDLKKGEFQFEKDSGLLVFAKSDLNPITSAIKFSGLKLGPDGRMIPSRISLRTNDVNYFFEIQNVEDLQKFPSNFIELKKAQTKIQFVENATFFETPWE
jgi:hypothetical protein